MKSKSIKLFSELYFKEHPELSKFISNRPNKYNRSIEFMRNPSQNLNIIEVNSPEEFKTKRFIKMSLL